MLCRPTKATASKMKRNSVIARVMLRSIIGAGLPVMYTLVSAGIKLGCGEYTTFFNGPSCTPSTWSS